jgi:hypothetical protein
MSESSWQKEVAGIEAEAILLGHRMVIVKCSLHICKCFSCGLGSLLEYHALLKILVNRYVVSMKSFYDILIKGAKPLHFMGRYFHSEI